ncbi:MAG TPA: hypothetical protein VLW50_14715 [Streptosporangiaceae bacterium]|nr:hypothetical protein [Streptosporangiaceae bacterium]
MADDQENSPGVISGVMQEFVAQLRGVTERLEGLTGLGVSLPSIPSIPSLPQSLRVLPAPGALSAAQLKTLSTTVAAQRHSVDALKAQLTAFDEQLVVLERILEPFVEWSKTWADIEHRVMNLRHGLGSEGHASDS